MRFLAFLALVAEAEVQQLDQPQCRIDALIRKDCGIQAATEDFRLDENICQQAGCCWDMRTYEVTPTQKYKLINRYNSIIK